MTLNSNNAFISLCSVTLSGGGVTLDLGIYAITMASLVFGGGRPESIQANGYLTNTGVDELVSVIVKYPGILCLMLSVVYMYVIISRR